MADPGSVVERVARESYGRLVAYLSVRTRDVAGAEDALADAFVAALRTWPRDGVPTRPEAWLLTAARRRIIDRVRQLRAQGVTFLIVEHNMDVVMNLCDPVIVMAYGKFLAHGSPAAIQNDDAVLEAYLGVA